jgi:hypothetical protein
MNASTMNATLQPHANETVDERRGQENRHLSEQIDVGVGYQRTYGVAVAKAYFQNRKISTQLVERVLAGQSMRRPTGSERAGWGKR